MCVNWQTLGTFIRSHVAHKYLKNAKPNNSYNWSHMKPQIARWASVTSHLTLVDVAIKAVSSAVKCKTLKKYSRQAELAKKEGNRIESNRIQAKTNETESHASLGRFD